MTDFPQDAPLVALKRGGLVESVHRGRVAVCDPSGEPLEAVGDSEKLFYPRSAIKPFQAMPLLLSGAADAFGLTEEEIAITCASHYGEERHVEAVRRVLEKAGLSEEDLGNGAHPPIHGSAAESLVRLGEEFGKIHGNCSGKHAGMMAVCVYKGWEVGGYTRWDHPLQRWIFSLISTVCDSNPEEMVVGVDGCGATTFAMPLKGLATGFARLATGENLPDDDVAQAAIQLREAMRSHPFLISGSGGFDTEIMAKTDLVAKGGADGVWAAGSERGWGLALKISDGASRAVRPAARASLRRRGVEIEDADSSAVRNLHGEEVGEIVSLR